MRFFTPYFALVLSLLLRPAMAKVYDVQVGANNDNLYAPVDLPPINIGDQVRFVYVSGVHLTMSDSSPAAWATFTLSNSTTTFTTPAFTKSGTYPYHCTAHGVFNGTTYIGMVGTITVSATPLATAASQPAGPALSFYPNPARGQIMVQLSAAAGLSYKVRLSNVLGREVRLLALAPAGAGPDGVPLDLGGLPAGLYFCSLLVNDKAVSTSRLTLL